MIKKTKTIMRLRREIDECRDSTRNNDNVFRKINLAYQITARNDCRHTLSGCLGKKRPHDNTEQQIDRVVLDFFSEFKEFYKYNVKDGRKASRASAVTRGIRAPNLDSEV